MVSAEEDLGQAAPRKPEPEPIMGPVLKTAEGDTKADIREKVWSYLESNNLSSFPRPVKNRIPNYKGSAAACDKGADLDVFKSAQTIKINPDKPQEQARFRTLEAEKTLLVPTPRLRNGLFNRILPPNTSKGALRYCSTSQGVRQHSTPLGLDMKVKVDLVIVGSVAVSPSGLRIGKGEGFADMEYGMMASIGAVNENTIVVTTVHECQIMDDLPEELFGPHDITVDYICTPQRVIKCNPRPKPKGIIWSTLGLEKFRQLPILKELRDLESAAGKNVALKEQITDEEIDAVIEEVNQAELERERDRPPRPRRDRRFRRGRRSEGDMVNGGHVDGGEHADGEESPSGEFKRRPQGDRRRRIRNRHRTSEQQNSEGEAPLSGEEGERRRRPPRRPRRPRNNSRNEPGSGAEEGEHIDGEQRRRPRRFRRPRNKSEGDREGEDEGQQGAEEQRRPRRFSNRRRPRNNSRQEGDSYRESPGYEGEESDGRLRRERPRRMNNLPSVYIGSLPKALRVSDFKRQVRDKDVNPLRVLWRGTNGHVFIMFQTMDETEDALRKLENLSINDKEVKVALANRTERRLRTPEDEKAPRQEVSTS